jgi:hypothetical protein
MGGSGWAKHSSRNAVRHDASLTIDTPRRGSLVMSSDGQNTSVSLQTKCGEPNTPRRWLVSVRHYCGTVGLVRHDDRGHGRATPA